MFLDMGKLISYELRSKKNEKKRRGRGGKDRVKEGREEKDEEG